MVATGSSSVLQRKLSSSHECAEASARSAAGALRLAIARAAADQMDMAVSVIGAIQHRSTQAGLGAHISDERLLILLDGPEGRLGAASLDRTCLTALIQQQTMGCLTGNEAKERPYTATDASMAAPLLNAALKQSADLAEIPADVQCLSGYSFGAQVEDSRSLLLALDYDRYRIFNLTLEFGETKQHGIIDLTFPDHDPLSEAVSGDAGSGAGRRLGHAIEMARAELSAVTSRMTLPLTEFSAMRPGDVLPLVWDHPGKTDLVTIEGETIASGRLGQVGGHRALRINETHKQPDGAEPEGGFAVNSSVPTGVLPQGVEIEVQVADNQSEDAELPEKPTPDQNPLIIDDVDLSELTPEQAAVEISELAGLPLLDDDKPEMIETAE